MNRYERLIAEKERVSQILEGFKQHPECKNTVELFDVMGWEFDERPKPDLSDAAAEYGLEEDDNDV
jgi:hypothetical protein